MNQIKIGGFLKELRKEKGLTQEQLAEQFNVSRRSVSRWETGSNLPDVDILIEMADYYEVDLRELIDGERKSEKMNEELKETVLKVADYSNEEKKRSTRIVLIFFVLGIIALILNIAIKFMELQENFFVGFLEGSTISLAIGAMVLGILYATEPYVKSLHLKEDCWEKKICMRDELQFCGGKQP